MSARQNPLLFRTCTLASEIGVLTVCGFICASAGFGLNDMIGGTGTGPAGGIFGSVEDVLGARSLRRLGKARRKKIEAPRRNAATFVELKTSKLLHVPEVRYLVESLQMV